MAKKSQPAAPTTKPCSTLPDTTLGDDVALVAENMERILGSPSYLLAQDDPKLLTGVAAGGTGRADRPPARP